MHSKCKLLFILNEPFFGDNLLPILRGNTVDPGEGENDKADSLFVWGGAGREGRGLYVVILSLDE